MSTPEQVPASLVAGDLWAWERDLSADYPASTWNGVWYFENAYKTFSVTAVASGDVFTASHAAATTAGYKPGRYRWQFVVTNGSDRRSIEQGYLEVTPDPAAAGTTDRRTHARRVLDAIEATIEGSASNDQLSISLGGRSLARRSLSELLELRTQYRLEVQEEESAEDVAAGLGSKKRIFVRLNRV